MAVRKILSVLILTAFALPVAAQDVSGKWNASVSSEFGEFAMTFEFMVEGDELKGSMSNDFMGAVPISQGMVDGSEITFRMEIAGGGGPAMVVNFTGVVDGDELTLTSVMEGGPGGAGEQTMVATRAE
jgi:hypothetical protein